MRISQSGRDKQKQRPTLCTMSRTGTARGTASRLPTHPPPSCTLPLRTNATRPPPPTYSTLITLPYLYCSLPPLFSSDILLHSFACYNPISFTCISLQPTLYPHLQSSNLIANLTHHEVLPGRARLGRLVARRRSGSRYSGNLWCKFWQTRLRAFHRVLAQQC